MSERKFRIHDQQSGAAIQVRVTPRAGRTMISAILADGTIKIRLASAPVDGRANDELVRYIAEILDVAESQIEIVSGKTGRDKLVAIIGLDSQAVQERIAATLEGKK